MRIHKSLKRFAITFIGAANLMSFSAAHGADVSLTCTEKYAKYIDAQKAWQTRSAARAAELLPEYVERINQYRDIQLLAIERRQHAVEFLLKKAPDQIESWGSINQWLQLTPELEEKLLKESTHFKYASERYNQKTAEPVASAADDFSTTFRKAALADSTFLELMENFNTRSREINALGCSK